MSHVYQLTDSGIRRIVAGRDELADARNSAQRALGHLSEHQPMTAEQRRILVMALGVLAVLDQ